MSVGGVGVRGGRNWRSVAGVGVALEVGSVGVVGEMNRSPRFLGVGTRPSGPEREVGVCRYGGSVRGLRGVRRVRDLSGGVQGRGPGIPVRCPTQSHFRGERRGVGTCG